MSENRKPAPEPTSGATPSLSAKTRWMLWLKYNATVLVAVSIYFAYGSPIAPKKADFRATSERLSVIVTEVGLEPANDVEVSLHTKFKNLSRQDIQSYILVPMAYDIKTKLLKQLAHSIGSNQVAKGDSFDVSTNMKKSELPSVVALCLLYTDFVGRTYVDVHYYSISSSVISSSLEPLSNLPSTEYVQSPPFELLSDRERIKLLRAREAAQSGVETSRPWDRDADGKRPWQTPVPDSSPSFGK